MGATGAGAVGSTGSCCCCCWQETRAAAAMASIAMVFIIILLVLIFEAPQTKSRKEDRAKYRPFFTDCKTKMKKMCHLVNFFTFKES